MFTSHILLNDVLLVDCILHTYMCSSDNSLSSLLPLNGTIGILLFTCVTYTEGELSTMSMLLMSMLSNTTPMFFIVLFYCYTV